MNSRSLSSRVLARVSTRCAGIEQVKKALEALTPDPRGYIASLFIKAVLLDYAEALGLTDDNVRACLYALDKTAIGEVSEDDLHAALLRPDGAPAGAEHTAESNQFQTVADELRQSLGRLFATARQAFDVLDTCSTGVVSQEQFRTSLGELGFELPEVIT